MDFFNVETHVWLSLPAAQHQVIHFFRTGPRALQHPALGYTLYHLQSERKTSIKLIVRRSPVPFSKEQIRKNKFSASALPSENVTANKLFTELEK